MQSTPGMHAQVPFPSQATTYIIPRLAAAVLGPAPPGLYRTASFLPPPLSTKAINPLNLNTDRGHGPTHVSAGVAGVRDVLDLLELGLDAVRQQRSRLLGDQVVLCLSVPRPS